MWLKKFVLLSYFTLRILVGESSTERGWHPVAGLDIINTLRQWREQGSKSNRRLAEVVLDDIDFASRASIADLAERAGVSEPTVTRFCRMLGCQGVRDLKHTLAQVLALGGPYLYPEPLDRNERDAHIVAAIADGWRG